MPSIYTAAPGTETTDAAATPSRTLNILLYEDTGDIGPWVKLTLDKMELQYTYVVGSGDLLKQLQSDTQWSLIIIASENQSSVQGDLWDLITQKVNTGSASLLAEMWSIDLIYQGKIKPFLDTCGVTLSSHYNLPRAVPVYLIDSQNAIFNTPNPGISLLKPIYHWDDQAVDYLQLLPDSHAKILAGGVEGDQNDNALITSCFDGRVILQTFLNHDYPEATIKALWENYITFMITTHK